MKAVRPKLLVSVVNEAETQAALNGNADLIDLKDPWEGALGAPNPEV
ncbi:MAG: (5-formylfuran-3-yl)methyl phosphate synthase, partial [Spirochaetota bacterium]